MIEENPDFKKAPLKVNVSKQNTEIIWSSSHSDFNEIKFGDTWGATEKSSIVLNGEKFEIIKIAVNRLDDKWILEIQVKPTT